MSDACRYKSSSLGDSSSSKSSNMNIHQTMDALCTCRCSRDISRKGRSYATCTKCRRRGNIQRLQSRSLGSREQGSRYGQAVYTHWRKGVLCTTL